MAAVHIIKPDLPKAKPGITTQEAFDKVWKGRGWQTVTAERAREIEQEIANPAPETPEAVSLAKGKTAGGAA